MAIWLCILNLCRLRQGGPCTFEDFKESAAVMHHAPDLLGMVSLTSLALSTQILQSDSGTLRKVKLCLHTLCPLHGLNLFLIPIIDLKVAHT
jgi:hypothetical protein